MWTRPSAEQHPTDDTADDTELHEDDEGDRLQLPIHISRPSLRPVRATAAAAGYDLCAAESVVLGADHQWVSVATGLKIAMSADQIRSRLFPNTSIFGTVRGRSGLTKKGVDVFHGTIDADYRGEIKVLMRNTTGDPVSIARDDRIAQLVFGLAFQPTLTECADFDNEFKTARGTGGFGSTGTSLVVSEPSCAPVESV